jgi:hypothetical protein
MYRSVHKWTVDAAKYFKEEVLGIKSDTKTSPGHLDTVRTNAPLVVLTTVMRRRNQRS